MTTKANTQAGADVLEMMNAWNKIQETARAQFPKATEEEIYQLSAGAMKHALGVKS